MKILTNRRARDSSARGVLPLLTMLVLVLLAVPQARAESIILSLVGAPVSDGGGYYDWKYSVTLTSQSSLYKADQTSGSITDLWFPDFVELYDFAGYKAGSLTWTANGALPVSQQIAASSWSLTAPMQDHVAEAAVFGAGSSEVTDDSSAVTNLKAAWDNNTAYKNLTNFDRLLGWITAKSLYNRIGLDTYMATDTKSTGASGKNSDAAPVPVVPSPETVWGGLALISMLGVIKGRRLMGF